MNMFKKGPEIKLPNVKVPDAVLDVYHDLRERHLLPVVLFLLVAIVAVPIALSQSSGSEGLEPSPSAIAIPSSVSGQQSGELVARAAPGLRDYRKRLHDLRSKDPFKQQYTDSEETGAETSAATGGDESSTAPGSVAPGATEPETTSPEPVPATPSAPEGHPGPGDLTYFSYAIDVRVVTGGSQQAEAAPEPRQPAEVRHNLPELTMLPSRQTPAAIYMGATKDGKKALLLISSNVQAVFGDGACVLGSQTCELLAVEPGLPETFVYGPEGHTYKIELLKIHLVTTDKLNRAPLGKPKSGE